MKMRGAPDSRAAGVVFAAIAAIALFAGLISPFINEAGAAAKPGSSPAAGQALSAIGNFQAGLDARQIKAGRSVFVGYCAECHVLFDPTWYAPEDWERLLSNMSGRAKLSRAQAEDLRSFIRTVRGTQ